MGRLCACLGGPVTWVLFVGLFLGLALPALATLARPLLAPAVAVLLTATLLRIDGRVMLGYLRRLMLAALIVAWLLLGAPLATAVVRPDAPRLGYECVRMSRTRCLPNH